MKFVHRCGMGRCSVVSTVMMLAGTALGRQGAGLPTGQPASAPVVAPAEDVLRGPKVGDEASGMSALAKKDFSGKLERVEGRPEQAAIGLLGLTDQERAGADAVLEERAVKVSSFTLSHYELFLKVQAARQGRAAPAEMRPLMAELRGEAKEFLDPPLADRVAAALPEAAREKFWKLVDDYKRELMMEEEATRRRAMRETGDEKEEEYSGGGRLDSMEAPKREATDLGPFVGRRVEMGLFLREMARSFGAFVDERRERTDALLKAIDATPEQENKIRGMMREFGAEKGFKPTADQRGELWRKVMAELTPEQRVKAVGAMRER